MLNSKQIRQLRGLAHQLKPVLWVGEKGLTENLFAELNQVLEDHELIKVSIAANREQRRLISEELCKRAGAELIQSIGRTSVLYRPAKEPRLQLK